MKTLSYHCDICEKEVRKPYRQLDDLGFNSQQILIPENSIESLDFCEPCWKRFIAGLKQLGDKFKLVIQEDVEI